jgi:hypothetical protein
VVAVVVQTPVALLRQVVLAVALRQTVEIMPVQPVILADIVQLKVTQEEQIIPIHHIPAVAVAVRVVLVVLLLGQLQVTAA